MWKAARTGQSSRPTAHNSVFKWWTGSFSSWTANWVSRSQWVTIIIQREHVLLRFEMSRGPHNCGTGNPYISTAGASALAIPPVRVIPEFRGMVATAAGHGVCSVWFCSSVYAGSGDFSGTRRSGSNGSGSMLSLVPLLQYSKSFKPSCGPYGIHWIFFSVSNT